MANLIFITRHEPTPEQVLIAQKLGYNDLKMISYTFYQNPIQELQDIGLIFQKYPLIALVLPAHITVQLWQAGFQTLEFRNIPNARAKGKFSREGAYRMGLDSQSRLVSEWIPLPLHKG